VPMVAASSHAQPHLPPDLLHAGFLALLPKVERCARAAFRHVPCPRLRSAPPPLRHVPCPCRRADAVAEVVALAWAWYRRCAERGKDAADFAAALAGLAARAVRSGRGLAGEDPSSDALAPLARHRNGFAVESLQDGDAPECAAYCEALHE